MADASKDLRAQRGDALKESRARRGDRRAAEVAGQRISHPDRVIDAASGLTKIDLALYYQSVAQYLLPHLRGRPVALLRAPDGLAGERFFQKHAQAGRLPGVKQLDAALDPGHPPLLEIASLQALIGVAQMNTIELHTWNAGTRDIEHPDRLVFDLDPGEGVAWPQMIEAARAAKSLLDSLGLVSFVKTSGSKGLHLLVPLAARHDWETVKAFSRAVVHRLATEPAERFVEKSGPSNRVGRIFIDYLRNGRGATTVAAYSARARPGLPVSMPIAWDELATLSSSAQWTIANAHHHLAASVAAWQAFARSRQSLERAIQSM